jgi:hypothetical protein
MAFGEELRHQTKALELMGEELLSIRDCGFSVVSATIRRHAREISALAERFVPCAAKRAA